jgi:hypothetical protein
VEGTGLFASLPIWWLFAATLVLVLLSVEAGYRRARYRQRRAVEEGDLEKEAPVGAMVGATLGLLAFLLAFTFGMAADSYHARKLAILDEANAIRAAYLRAEIISEPHRTEVRKILRDYVEERLQWAGEAKTRSVQSSRALLGRLWAQAAAEGRKNSSDVIALFVESANDVIKLHEERVMFRERSRIPGALWTALYLITVLSLASMGYHGGVAGTTRSPVMVAVAIAFSLVIVVIADLDRPGEGWINVTQDAMIDLRNALAESKP